MVRVRMKNRFHFLSYPFLCKMTYIKLQLMVSWLRYNLANMYTLLIHPVKRIQALIRLMFEFAKTINRRLYSEWSQIKSINIRFVIKEFNQRKWIQYSWMTTSLWTKLHKWYIDAYKPFCRRSVDQFFHFMKRYF